MLFKIFIILQILIVGNCYGWTPHNNILLINGPATPPKIGELVLWLDATDPFANGTTPSNNQVLNTWYDKSGNANNVTGTNVTWRSALFNSRPTMDFPGGNLSKASPTNLNLGTGDFLICFVIKNNVSGGFGHLVALPDQNTFTIKRNNDTGQSYAYMAATATSIYTNPWIGTSLYYNCLRRQSGTCLWQVGASIPVSGGSCAGTINPTAINVGQGYPGENGLYAYYSELLIYRGNISTTNYNFLIAYIKRKWGL